MTGEWSCRLSCGCLTAACFHSSEKAIFPVNCKSSRTLLRVAGRCACALVTLHKVRYTGSIVPSPCWRTR